MIVTGMGVMSLKDYLELFRVKPISLLSTVIILGYWLGLPPYAEFSWVHLLLAVLAPSIAASGAFALNQYYEYKADAQMKRTEHRPIPSGRIKPQLAHVLGYGVFVFALAVQWFFVSQEATIATALCGITYVWLYTPLKNLSVHSTIFGSIPGMFLPLIGWFSIQDSFSGLVIWMAVMLFVWQIPHTLVICYRHQLDYKQAGFKQLPFVHGDTVAFKQLVWWCVMRLPLSLMPFVFDVAGVGYLIASLTIGLLIVVYALALSVHPSEKNAKTFFFIDLSYLPVLFIAVIVG
ncbi:MAG: heme o synthase [Fibrobacterales bacterium]